LSFWRSERRNNYKRGTLDTLGPVFELRENYICWYRLMILDVSMTKAAIDG
jgi:hypothetical protein